MQKDLAFTGNAFEMAQSLVWENGLDRARQIALEGTTAANERGNLYRLSVWREVKVILGKWTENAT